MEYYPKIKAGQLVIEKGEIYHCGWFFVRICVIRRVKNTKCNQRIQLKPILFLPTRTVLKDVPPEAMAKKMPIGVRLSFNVSYHFLDNSISSLFSNYEIL